MINCLNDKSDVLNRIFPAIIALNSDHVCLISMMLKRKKHSQLFVNSTRILINVCISLVCLLSPCHSNEARQWRSLMEGWREGGEGGAGERFKLNRATFFSLIWGFLHLTEVPKRGAGDLGTLGGFLCGTRCSFPDPKPNDLPSFSRLWFFVFHCH